MAIVAKGQRTRVYLPPNDDHAAAAKLAKPTWRPDCELPEKHRNFQTPAYGMSNLGDLFTARQLVALSTFSDLVEPAREKALQDALASGMPNSGTRLRDAGDDAVAYADAIATYLGLVVSRSANTLCSLAVWSQSREQTVNVFSRQALPMNWDFPEVNPFAGAAGDFGETAASMAKSIEMTPATSRASVLRKRCHGRPCSCGERGNCNRSALLRQHRLFRLVRFLLCLATPSPCSHLSRSFQYIVDAESPRVDSSSSQARR